MTGKKYIRNDNGKLYKVMSDEDGTVVFKRDGMGTHHYLGKAEFERRFRPADPDAPPASTQPVAMHTEGGQGK
jgi:hypothetical protein